MVQLSNDTKREFYFATPAVLPITQRQIFTQISRLQNEVWTSVIIILNALFGMKSLKNLIFQWFCGIFAQSLRVYEAEHVATERVIQ